MQIILISWVLQLIGHLHPLLVHFPIAILIIVAFFEVLDFSGKQTGLRIAIYWLVILGCVSAGLSALAGIFLESSENYSGDAVNLHKYMGLATTGFSIITLLLLSKARKNQYSNLLGYRVTLLITVVVLTITGHQGALLTHGDDYISRVLPWNESGYDLEETTALYVEMSNQADSLSTEQLDRLNLEVRAIFAHQCYQCHSEHKKEGGLVLENEDMAMIGGENGAVILPGNAGESELIRRLELPANHDDVMPKKGKKLTQSEIDIIRLWIDKGAHWADAEFKVFPEAELALSKPKLPAKKEGIDNPVDLWVNEHFEENNINWPEVVSDRIFLKRAWLDITGLLPSPEDYRNFLNDNAPDKRQQLIETLLNNHTAYTEHWISFWNDLLRNDYSGPGYITGGRKQITDWLYQSLMSNKPYDSMVMQLIDPTSESEGFIRGIQWRGDVNASQTVEMQAAQNIGQSLLGVNLKCASCHNSFISNLKLKQAYDFANIFTDSTMEIYRCGKPVGKTASPAFIYPELGEISGTTSAERLNSLAQLMVKRENGRLYRTFVNRIWGKLLGRGIIERYDEMDNHPWSGELLDWLAADFADTGKDIKKLIATIMSSKTYQIPSVYYDKIEAVRSDQFVFRGPLVRRLSAEQFADAVSTVIEPMYHSVSYDPFKTEISASWIWKREVEFDRDVLPKPGKRYFRHVFQLNNNQEIESAQVIISVDHSYILYLNGERIGTGNNWQKVDKYELTSHVNGGKNLIAIEAENEGQIPNPAGILFSMKIKYKDEEEPQFVYSGKDWKATDHVEGDAWKTNFEIEEDWEPARNQNRRHWGVLQDYTFERTKLNKQPIRASLVKSDPFLKALGRPTRENVATRRESQATLLQALELTNGEFLFEVLGAGADQWISEDMNAEDIGKEIYMQALGRSPKKEELSTIQEMLGAKPEKEKVQDLFWAVLMLPEFQFIY